MVHTFAYANISKTATKTYSTKELKKNNEHT